MSEIDIHHVEPKETGNTERVVTEAINKTVLQNEAVDSNESGKKIIKKLGGIALSSFKWVGKKRESMRLIDSDTRDKNLKWNINKEIGAYGYVNIEENKEDRNVEEKPKEKLDYDFSFLNQQIIKEDSDKKDKFIFIPLKPYEHENHAKSRWSRRKLKAEAAANYLRHKPDRAKELWQKSKIERVTTPTRKRKKLDRQIDYRQEIIKKRKERAGRRKERIERRERNARGVV